KQIETHCRARRTAHHRGRIQIADNENRSQSQRVRTERPDRPVADLTVASRERASAMENRGAAAVHRRSISAGSSYASSLPSVEPISAGVGATAMPAALSAAILSAAAPLPPEMIAPACPIRLPGGAVWPPMNAATGLVTQSLMNSAARSSES